MSAEPSDSDGLRICVMRDARVYNRQLKAFEERYGRPMYDMHLKSLAPSRSLLTSWHNQEITWDDGYVPEFRKEVLIPQADLIRVLAFYAIDNNITYLCTENTPAQCHRRLLAEESKIYQPSLELIIE